MRTVINPVKTVTTMRRVLFFSVLLASATMAGHSMASAQAPMPAHTGMAPGMAMPAGKAPMKMHTAMEDMQKKMSGMTMTGKTDIDFAMMMVAHHQAAIDMAKAELESGKDPAMLSTAKKIIAAQTKEIAQLEAWLKKNPHGM